MADRLINIVEEALDINAYYSWLYHESCGAVLGFTGCVRNHSLDKEVRFLEFESYREMALKEMNRIADEVAKENSVKKIAMIHAVGKKEIIEPVVFCGIAAAHRDEAFLHCRYLIDELKKRVAIWKKETFTDSSHWLNANP